MPARRKRMSALPAFVLLACGSMLLIGCPNSLDGPSPIKTKFGLTVLERSATTLKVQWDPITDANGDGYTVDYLTGYLNCGAQIATHSNVLEVANVTTVTVTGLSASTDYHVHVHRLNGHQVVGSVSGSAFVRTLASGSAVQPVATTEYQKC